jgi:hypothetical protein
MAPASLEEATGPAPTVPAVPADLAATIPAPSVETPQQTPASQDVAMADGTEFQSSVSLLDCSSLPNPRLGIFLLFYCLDERS